ncbi:UDP-xylose and UDP-N-acetylglucosamine transporter [Dendryphion nanum]|uniref:UDP-xylose and UDP-N-acetylglucosamine transporter n=1 Tax=Dendryphion nanum TaxID=256645 RepID=A0A9P9D1X4_9PLEO|nr:UDP-xylose and UDP-N-acetylglucosamine transporter [Dendryphion nanum]
MWDTLTERPLIASFIPQFSSEALSILFLIFGGCCTNVYSLEAIIRHNISNQPALGLTFVQFLFTSVEGFAYFFRAQSKTFLKQPEVPRIQWLGIAVIHFSISILNNLSLDYQVSVPMHIVLRSGGGLVTLCVGTLFRNTYSRTKWMSVIVMTLGVLITTVGRAKDSMQDSVTGVLTIGVFLLLVMQILVAFMGITLEKVYKRSPRAWREGVFYTHFFALPFFLPLLPKINAQLIGLASGVQLEVSMPRFSHNTLDLSTKLLLLVLNALTQFLCVTGVNLLTSVSSALSVCIVLTIRKLVSLLISIWIFGTAVEASFIVGAITVFGGAIAYAMDEWKLKKQRTQGHAEVEVGVPLLNLSLGSRN